MADYTAEQFKNAARKAWQNGDTETARKLIQRAKAAETAQPASDNKNQDGTYGSPPSDMFPNPKTGQMTSRNLLANANPANRAEAAGIGYMQGFSANLTDEMMGGVGYMEGGPEMANLRREQFRAKEQSARNQFPKTTLAGDLTGAVTSPINRALGPANSVRAAAGQGAVSAAAYAAGAAEGDDRVDAAWKAAIPGAIFGAGTKKAVDFGGKAFQRLFRQSAERPTVQSLKATKNAAYNAVDESGATFSKQDMEGLFQKVQQNLDASDFDDIADPQTAAALKMLERRQGEELTIGRLDKIRQTLWQRYNRGNEPLVLDMIDEIDDLVASKGDTSELMAAARLANSRFKKAELLENAFNVAERQTAATGSGGNILNKYRQAVSNILNNPKKARWFTPEEVKVMDAFVRGSVPENVMRRIGKLSPSGNGLMMALNLGAAAVDPAMLAVTAAGAGAKEIADRSVERGRDRLLSAVSGFTPDQVNIPLPRGSSGVPGVLAGQMERNR